MADTESTKCPWRITVHAVDRYSQITGLARQDAQTELEEVVRRTWHHHQETGKQPRPTATGALTYRTPQPRRLKLVIAPDNKIVDVGAAFDGMERRGR